MRIKQGLDAIHFTPFGNPFNEMFYMEYVTNSGWLETREWPAKFMPLSWELV